MTTFRALKELGFVGLDTSTTEYRRYHNAAGQGRRTAGWFAPEAGPNAVIFADQAELIRRSRSAYRNNGWIKQGSKRHVANEVGAYIRPLFEFDNPEVKTALNKQWKKFVKHADADGVLNFYGQLALASLTRFSGAECFIRIRPRRMPQFPVPFQVQLLESEMVPTTLFKTMPNGNEVMYGIEFNRQNQKVAWHFYKYHPSDWTSLQAMGKNDINDTVRVPASLVIHHFEPERPGQCRGRPATVQSLVAAFEYQEYSDAERVRKKIKAHHTAFLERGEYPESDDFLYDPMTGKLLDGADDDQTNIEAGMYNVLNPGEKVKFPDGDVTGAGYSDYQYWEVLSQAAGFAQPYQIYSGDLRGMNDRLWRAITNEWYRMIDMGRDHLVVHQICEKVKDFFVDAMWLNNLVDMPDYENRRDDYLSVEWQPQARKFLHPVQDIQAKKLEKEEGFNSRSAIITEMGRDPENVDRQRAEDHERAEKLGLNMPLPMPGNQQQTPADDSADDNPDDQQTGDSEEQ